MVDCFFRPIRIAFLSSKMLISPDKCITCVLRIETVTNRCYVNRQIDVSLLQGCSGAETRGAAFPHFFRQGDASPTPPTFWIEIHAKVSPLLQLVTY